MALEHRVVSLKLTLQTQDSKNRLTGSWQIDTYRAEKSQGQYALFYVAYKLYKHYRRL